ncbi:phosphotransferase [Pseudonocardia nantongensis]|uniref:phosphotransferase n=1 Tax=Pseudonocardia nantongensis TaxID=1181885 RepID=UPI003979FA22
MPAHADLGAEHLLADGDRITGVLDWSDTAVTDPAAYGPVDAATRRRVVFFARAGAPEDCKCDSRHVRSAGSRYTRTSEAIIKSPLRPATTRSRCRRVGITP